ncbi:MAG: amino acid permease, partial [Sulfitobacter sp.]
LGGTTALLLLAVFAVVNVAVLVLRSDTVDHDHFTAPMGLPYLGAASCVVFVGPWTGRDPVQYLIAGILLGIGVALWAATVFYMKSQDNDPGAGDMSELAQ